MSKCIKLSCQRFHVIPFSSSSDQHTFIIRFSDPKPGRNLQVHLINHTFLLVNSFLRFFVESTAQQTIQCSVLCTRRNFLYVGNFLYRVVAVMKWKILNIRYFQLINCHMIEYDFWIFLRGFNSIKSHQSLKRHCFLLHLI